MRGTTRKNIPKRSWKKRQRYRENNHKYNQLSAWVALTVFSVISVVSLSTSQDKRYWNSDLRYSLAMASMSLIVGTTASAFHLLCLMGNTFSRQSLMEVFLVSLC